MDSKALKKSETLNKDKNKVKENNKNEDSKQISPLENIQIIDEFDEQNYKVRKYNLDNLENCKKFYKLRYIKRKIDEKKNKSSSNIKNNNEILIKLDASEKEKILKNEDLILNHKKTKQKNIQKYSYLFLILLEKSIIFFNFKNYQKSYDILYDYNIIQNPIEFGEILLTIKGYDRALKIDFINKKVYPNEKGEVLKGIINSIEINNFQDILSMLRLLFYEIKIPLEKEQQITLVREISSNFYEKNKKNEKFIEKYKTKENIELLLRTIIEVLLSFRKKEEFREIIKFIEKEEEKVAIYNLVISPFEYYNDIYERLNFLLMVKPNIFDNKDKTKINKEEYSDYYEYLETKELKEEEIEQKFVQNINSFEDYGSNLNCFQENDKNFLTKPIKFYRINGANATNLKEYVFFDDFKKLAFEKSIQEAQKKLKHFILTDDIIDVFLGTRHGENFKKYLKAYPKEENNQNMYLNIVCNKEQLDLKSNDKEEGIKWYKSLKSLLYDIKKHNKINDKNKNEDEKKMRDDIEFIWNNILGKWEIYGNYFLFKCIDHSNYLPDMYYEGKQQAKIEIFDEKKTPLIKVINNFVKDMKEKVSKKDAKNLEYNEFFALCQIGLSEYSRRKIWPILIGNKCGITNTFYDSLKEKITQINNFDELERKYKDNNDITFVDNYNINKMIKDIIKIKYLFLDEIDKGLDTPGKIMSQVYSICRCFFSHRYDIPYSKNIIPLIYTLLLKNIDEETTFISIYNIICSNTSISKVYMWKEKKKNLKNLEIFFEERFKVYLPRLSQYFEKLGITCDLFLYDWIESLFTQSLDIKIASKIIDSYLIFGEYILIQTSIVILKMLEEELLNYTIDEIFKNLRKPFKTNIINFFDVFRNYTNIKEAFKENRVNKEFGDQKTELLEVLIKLNL